MYDFLPFAKNCSWILDAKPNVAPFSEPTKSTISASLALYLFFPIFVRVRLNVMINPDQIKNKILSEAIPKIAAHTTLVRPVCKSILNFSTIAE